MFGIIDDNKKFILLDENRDRLYKTAQMVAEPAFNVDLIDEKICEYGDDEFEKAWDGNIYVKGFAPQPDNDYQSHQRERAYALMVDPITSHISRLRDKEQTEEVVAEIAELMVERDTKVEEIKEMYPYSAK